MAYKLSSISSGKSGSDMRHRFHAICPYFAMFPESFVRKNLIWSKPGDIIFDPFVGRGTTVFESLLADRAAFGCDINPVAVCVSNAKAKSPRKENVVKRINEIRKLNKFTEGYTQKTEFFKQCFHEKTWSQLIHLKKMLKWETNDIDCFIAAIALGCLHGESHRSNRYFSNRMPRTISTKPEYSIKWWRKNGYRPPERDVYKILLQEVDYRFESLPPKRRGNVLLSDARNAAWSFKELTRKVSLIITSPPYLDTTNFQEDQWLRIWFLGGPETPKREFKTDDRHTSFPKYWEFLKEAWAGIAPLLKKDSHIIIRIGGKGMDLSTCYEALQKSLTEGLEKKTVLINQKQTPIIGGQVHTFRPGVAGVRNEYDYHFALK